MMVKMYRRGNSYIASKNVNKVIKKENSILNILLLEVYFRRDALKSIESELE